jgi:flagellar biosynthesis anti-sigma factor FlgM
MRINNFQNIPALLQSVGTGSSNKTSSESDSAGSPSTVSLSSFAEVLQSLQRETTQAAKARGTQVQQLAAQVESGEFSVDATKLAARLVDLQVIDIQG